jgi:hypothetical protein
VGRGVSSVHFKGAVFDRYHLDELYFFEPMPNGFGLHRSLFLN